jgi:hypothetical protein
MIRVVGIEPLRKHALQHRNRQEWAGHFDQGEPFGVVARGGHGVSYAATGRVGIHSSASVRTLLATSRACRS